MDSGGNTRARASTTNPAVMAGDSEANNRVMKGRVNTLIKRNYGGHANKVKSATHQEKLRLEAKPLTAEHPGKSCGKNDCRAHQCERKVKPTNCTQVVTGLSASGGRNSASAGRPVAIHRPAAECIET
jgi:hypothetical protein